MNSARIYGVVYDALTALNDVEGGTFDGTLTVPTLNGPVVEFLVEAEDGEHYAAEIAD